MSLSRRDFMKLFGVSVASLLLSRCQSLPGLTSTPRPTKTPEGPTITCYDMAIPPTPTPPPVETMVGCYEPTMPPVATPTSAFLAARGRLRVCWLNFGEVSRQAYSDPDNALGEQLLADHRAALDELVAAGELSAPVADLVHEAYGAAVYHVWRTAAPITCYIIGPDNYTVASVGVLVQQSEVLGEAAAAGTIDPETLAIAQTALEHDLAFFALSDEDLRLLYEQANGSGQGLPPFDELDLELTPEAHEAAFFILGLLAGE